MLPAARPEGRSLGRAFYLGRMFEHAALHHPDAEVRLDCPLDIAPDSGLVHTYAELAGLVDDLASRLWQAGVRPSEPVVVHKAHSFDIPLLACAASRIGAVPVLLSPVLDAEVVVTLLGRLGSAWLLTDASRLHSLADGRDLAMTSVILTAGEPPPGTEGRVIRLAAPGEAPAKPPVELHPRQPALITHSSGTTGIPKLMVHTAQTLWHRLAPQKMIAWPVRGSETVLLAMSFVHSRFLHSLGVFLPYGNPLVISAGQDVATIRGLLLSAKPGVVETHPNNFVLWEDLADDDAAPLSCVRYYSSTFDAIHPSTIRRLLAASRRRDPRLVQLYGQSETGPISCAIYTERSAERIDGRYVGLPLPGFIKIRAVDDQGRPRPRGTAGHLEVRSRGRALTYLGEDERHRAQLHDGWWRLGDVGYVDRLNRLYLVDRAVDQISGVDSNLAIEDMLLSRLPQLAEVVVVPDTDGSPLPIVATRGDVPLDRVRWGQCAAGLPPMKTPVQWRFDDFPRTSTWKIRRLEIRGMWEQGRAPSPIHVGE